MSGPPWLIIIGSYSLIQISNKIILATASAFYNISSVVVCTESNVKSRAFEKSHIACFNDDSVEVRKTILCFVMDLLHMYRYVHVSVLVAKFMPDHFTPITI